ncbi:MAG: hypothetical protein MR902_00330 [Campylobacter sp.]|nr:hypothetical protein [Campylobacter sp.]
MQLDTEINPACGVGINIQISLQEFYDKIQSGAEKSISKITLKSIVDKFKKNVKNSNIKNL